IQYQDLLALFASNEDSENCSEKVMETFGDTYAILFQKIVLYNRPYYKANFDEANYIFLQQNVNPQAGIFVSLALI
ncbi:MAG: hypothetical protein QXU75_09540, partial [Candidatus Methanomethylicaceae archaeon]